ncbi:phytanoyl-CoA dioxygenase family protein [Salmonirosea aquatica]|uniref:Phytanoyl-CoA dioxygenase family protein n=1 Tax=Salmonirosea aquatica TaxID=2654236 RepID=A0A7C9FN06_9BACT|nr:phytanoyl-CoA dioxygenase family protein [Cytophagaceae bacterium SJW1-29]
METIRPLPSLDSRYPVSESQKASYQSNGHVLLRNIVSEAEMEAYRPVILDAADRYNTEKRKMEERDTYGKAFLQIMNLWEVDEAVRKFTLARRFAGIAADLMGVKNVRLYHDQALFKEAGGGYTPWHQDQYYWPLNTNNTITMWMPLVDINIEMGMLTFASGSQNLGYLGDLDISDTSESVLSDLVKERGYPISRAETMKAGDATWHSGWTLHAAPGNLSDTLREVMTVIYMDADAKIIEPRNPHQKNDLARWLQNAPVGSGAASELNPLLL